MSSKKWDDVELARVSAELDAELEEIFAEVDHRVKRRSDPEAGLPKAEILPDDFDDGPRKTAPFRFDGPGDPPEIEILPDDFEPDYPAEKTVGDFEPDYPAEKTVGDFEPDYPAEKTVGDFEPDYPAGKTVGDFSRISPAEVFDADFTVEAENRRPGGSAAPSRRDSGGRPEAGRPAPAGAPEESDDESKFFPSAHYNDFRAATVGQMKPDDFGRLIERAVERAILSAIAKAGL